MTYEAAMNWLLDPCELSQEQRRRLEAQFRYLSQRPVRTVFEELGFELCSQSSCPHPHHPYECVSAEAMSLATVMPDRRVLDEVVFEALELTEQEQLEVYRAVVELVKARLVKAQSV